MTLLKLPPLCDPHVHIRDLAQAHKEDWDSGTAAALAGGYTCVLAMPNTDPPVTDSDSLVQYQAAARARARCDYGLYLGAGDVNTETAAGLAPQTCGLKMYLDQTFGPLRIDDLGSLMAHMERWPANKPLAVHAEGRTVAAAILVAQLAGRAVHICHVSRKDEIELIHAAKDRGLDVTCEVTPHHLFLTAESAEAMGLRGGYAEVRPRLALDSDRLALWQHLAAIDCFATDHAPHTRAEKESANPPPGFPGLETALALLLGAVHDGRLTLDDISLRTHTNVKRIFHLPDQPDTYIEVDPDLEWLVRPEELFTRCHWSPWEGQTLRGRVVRTVLRGQVAYEHGNVLAQPGIGKDITQNPKSQQPKPQSDKSVQSVDPKGENK
ncbi:MAG: dihydroorotase [Chloroflexi bacterium]|nr:dihydroorotase [Chloroflexota bacterium]